MKKILFGMMAAGMMFATSCQNDLELSDSGNMSTVSFKIGTPEIASRAYSDGNTATVLQYAVYDAAGNELGPLTVVDNPETTENEAVTMADRKATVNLQLVTGNKYSVIFWAAAPNAPYKVNFAEKKMTVNYSSVDSNDENLDAFYARHDFTVTGAQTETIELKRPFAQLNIGTADYVASENAGYVPTQSTVTVKNIYNTLYLWEGNVSNDQKVTFHWADIKKDEAFPVDGNKYLAMNYLLVPTKEDSHLIEVEFSYKDGNENTKTRTVGSVPVNRNYRTNIYGQLLTSNVGIKVEINPDYNEPAYEAEALFLAAAVGGEVTLTEDVVLTSPLNVQANMILNMNGKTITGALNVANGVSLIVENGSIVPTSDYVNGITSNGNLTLNNVNVTSTRHAVRIESGSAVINGGIYQVNPTTKSTLYALHVGDDNVVANVTIKGGTFIGPKGTSADSGSAVNVKKGSTVTIEGGDFSKGKNNTLAAVGTLTIKGGSFDQNPKAEWIAEGLKALIQDSKYYVVPEGIDAVATTPEELNNALENKSDVLLTTDIVSTSLLHVSGGILDGNGFTVTPAWSSTECGIMVKEGTVQNLVVKDSPRALGTGNGGSYLMTGDVYYKNVTTVGSTYGINISGGNGHKIFVEDCTIGDWNSYAGLSGAEFTNCTFVAEGHYKAAQRIYGDVTFTYKNCTFPVSDPYDNKGYYIDGENGKPTIIFENCKLSDGTLITDEVLKNKTYFQCSNFNFKINND